MLNYQTIRGNVKIARNDSLIDKDTLISLSENWSEKQETLFRKMLKQGGIFKINGDRYQIIPEEQMLNSRGNIDNAITPMDHTGDDVDENYLR